MSTIGLSWDHVRTFNPLSRTRTAARHAFSPLSFFIFLSLSLCFFCLSLSLSLFLSLSSFPFIFFLSSHSYSHAYPATLSYPFHATIEIKRIDRVCTEKEARRTGKTLSTARTYDLFRREAPTRNIRYP